MTEQQIRVGGFDSGPMAMALASGRMSRKAVKALSTYWTIREALTVARGMRNKMRAKLTYTVTVEGSDDLYSDVLAAVTDSLPPKDRRAMRVHTQDRWVAESIEPSIPSGGGGSESKTPVMRASFDGSTEQTLDIDGYQIKVAVSSEVDGGAEAAEYRRRYSKVVFTCIGIDARDAVVRWLQTIADNRFRTAERKPRLYLAQRWGDWSRHDELLLRPFSSVVLRKGVVEELIGHVETFRSFEADYVRMGQPYHTGFLLHGPPGSGKTSVAKALAQHFGMDVFYIPLADMTADTNLLNLVSRVTRGSMLLLEDVDVNHAATERSDTASSASLSGLLNSLDGITTPHGLVTVMTTNHIDRLDPALIRPGRVDAKVLIDYVDSEQLGRLVHTFLGTNVYLGEIPDGVKITSAQVVQVIMRHLGDREGALDALSKLIFKDDDPDDGDRALVVTEPERPSSGPAVIGNTVDFSKAPSLRDVLGSSSRFRVPAQLHVTGGRLNDRPILLLRDGESFTIEREETVITVENDETGGVDAG